MIIDYSCVTSASLSFLSRLLAILSMKVGLKDACLSASRLRDLLLGSLTPLVSPLVSPLAPLSPLRALLSRSSMRPHS